MTFDEYNEVHSLGILLIEWQMERRILKCILPLCLQFVRWQNSKRLINGSLVCLSCDNFESFLFATVTDRDPKDLQKGQVQISFTEESRYKLARIEVRR